ncbi:hypothetical protein Q3G72_013331 [Acer saccharum]|nr:hypothetical protein Q3G72_013331 [Acer saccharum]
MHNENCVQSEGLQELLWGSSSSYIPQVKPECKPKLDQEFTLIDDVHEFYNQYAKEAGFSVRSNSTRKNKDTDEIVRKEYVCSKEGMSSQGVASENKRRKGITRENCNAKLAVVRTKIGTYKVSVFVEDHSHPLTSPRKVHLLRAIARQRREELTADHVDVNEKPMLKMPNLIERQMAETYTHKIFYTFQQELWNSFFYDIELVRENGDHFVYIVKKQDESSCQVREIVFKKELDFTSCSCKKFESEGIPCRHILAYLNHMQVRSLPNQYILKRWTQTAKCNKVIDEDGLEINDFFDKSFMVRRMRLFQLATYVIDKAACIEDASKILEDILNNAILDNKSTLGSGGSGGVSKRNNIVQHVYNEPLAVRAKGCGKRLKGGKEKAKNMANDRGRRCNGCGKVGQAHDKRNFPILNNSGSVCNNDTTNLIAEDEDSISSAASNRCSHEQNKNASQKASPLQRLLREEENGDRNQGVGLLEKSQKTQ